MKYATCAAIAALAALFILGALEYGAQRTAALDHIADCVHAEANHAGYAGNPYSREAWETFAPLCK